MNQRDRDNLKFLLEASPKTIDVWYAQASDDDIIYAEDLLNLFELELIDSKVIDSSDCVDIECILEKFRKV